MKRAITAWTFRENWPLVLVFTLAVLGAGAGLYKGLDGDETMAAADPVELLNPNTVMSEEEMRAVLFAPPAPQPPTVAEQNMGALAGHRRGTMQSRTTRMRRRCCARWPTCTGRQATLRTPHGHTVSF
jgi:hypothetical protein